LHGIGLIRLGEGFIALASDGENIHH